MKSSNLHTQDTDINQINDGDDASNSRNNGDDHYINGNSEKDNDNHAGGTGTTGTHISIASDTVNTVNTVDILIDAGAGKVDTVNIDNLMNMELPSIIDRTKSLRANDFDNQNIIISVDSHNNSYFKLLPKKYALFFYYKIALNKKYAATMATIIISFTVLSGFGIFGMFGAMGWITASLLGITYALGLNIDIAKLIVKSFDFWFKVFNSLLTIISQFIIFSANGSPLFTQICVIFAEIWLMIVIFMADAFYISAKLKIFLLMGAIITCFGFAGVAYYTFEDVNWNPFSFKETEISFKNTFISSATNVGLFTLKGVLSLLEDMKDNENLMVKLSTIIPANVINDPQYIFFKSFTVSKEPYFKWKIYMENINDNN